MGVGQGVCLCVEFFSFENRKKMKEIAFFCLQEGVAHNKKLSPWTGLERDSFSEVILKCMTLDGYMPNTIPRSYLRNLGSDHTVN